MPGVVLDGERAVIFDRKTRQALFCTVPTALENVANGQGRFVHGHDGAPWDGEPGEAPPPAEAPIQLTEPDVLPLPAPEPEVTYPDPETQSAVKDRLQPFVDPSAHAPTATPLTPAQTEALDHDGDKKAGGSTPKAGRSPEEEAERAALFAEFKARGVKVFAGSTTEKLREKLTELTAA